MSGTLAQTYILAQGPDGLILIDQRRLTNASSTRPSRPGAGGGGPNPALSPVVEVNPGQADWVKANLSQLAQAGLTLEPSGGELSDHRGAGPLAHADLEAVVAEAVEALRPPKASPGPRSREAALQIMACRGAVKAGEVLAPRPSPPLLVPLGRNSRLLPLPHGPAPVAPE